MSFFVIMCHHYRKIFSTSKCHICLCMHLRRRFGKASATMTALHQQGAHFCTALVFFLPIFASVLSPLVLWKAVTESQVQTPMVQVLNDSQSPRVPKKKSDRLNSPPPVYLRAPEREIRCFPNTELRKRNIVCELHRAHAPVEPCLAMIPQRIDCMCRGARVLVLSSRLGSADIQTRQFL